ncbi:MAG TPA: hypothetical protein GX745_05695 [Clostridiales bacterium]|jgi:hypothetical protein|nr:hypothetical protein [Clostridiales bacterium]
MKRFLIFLAFILIFIALGIVNQDLLFLKSQYPDMKVVFYTTEKPMSNDHNLVFDGIYHQIHCDAKSAAKVKSALSNIRGMSVSFQGTIKDIDYILDFYKVKVIFETYQNQIFYIYGYSDLINAKAVKIDDNYVNIQLALRKNTVTVGAPIILGSY